MMSRRALILTIALVGALAMTARLRALKANGSDDSVATNASVNFQAQARTPAPAPPSTPSTSSQLSQPSLQAAKSDTVSGSTQSLSALNAQSSAQPQAPAALAKPTQAELERQSIETLTSLLSDVVSTDSSPARLVSDLMGAGYEPLASRDADPVTGSMIVIETKNTLPGSRYFRAQYFSDEDGNYQPQHISFELRPGTPKAGITKALAKAFGGTLPAPSYQDAEWTSYKLPGGFSLWTKVLNRNDVQENAIFAHSPEDVGTIQVAIEKEIPGHEDEP